MDQTQNAAQPQVARSMFIVGFFMLLSAGLMLLLARSNKIAPIERIVDEDAHVVAAEASQDGTPGR